MIGDVFVDVFDASVDFLGGKSYDIAVVENVYGWGSVSLRWRRRL